MQGDNQAEGAPRVDQLYIGSKSGRFNTIGVAGSRFLRGVTGYVDCEGQYKKVIVMCMP